MDGVLLVDKPRGPTSHDVVGRVRKLFGTRAVGHAGTLDPMATGLLVLGLGEGTKLLAAFDQHDKRYEADIRLGASTATLDAEGEVTGTAPIPIRDDDALERALATFRGAIRQQAPAYSALKQGGVPLHTLARKGVVVDAPVRDVFVHSVTAQWIDAETIRVRVHTGKGFYVRSFARDLAEVLGTLGHLVQLRRSASGPFDVAEAATLDALQAMERDERPTRLLGLAAALRGIPRLRPDDVGATHARHGRPVPVETVPGAEAIDVGARCGFLLPHDRLLALVTRRDTDFVVDRGFVEGQRAYDAAKGEAEPCST